MKRMLMLFALPALLALLLLPSCGGGGDGPEGSSNWDEMVWDTDSRA